MNNNIQKLLDAWIAEDEVMQGVTDKPLKSKIALEILMAIAEINKTDVLKSQKLIRMWQDKGFIDYVNDPNSFLVGWRYE